MKRLLSILAFGMVPFAWGMKTEEKKITFITSDNREESLSLDQLKRFPTLMNAVKEAVGSEQMAVIENKLHTIGPIQILSPFATEDIFIPLIALMSSKNIPQNLFTEEVPGEEYAEQFNKQIKQDFENRLYIQELQKQEELLRNANSRIEKLKEENRKISNSIKDAINEEYRTLLDRQRKIPQEIQDLESNAGYRTAKINEIKNKYAEQKKSQEILVIDEKKNFLEGQEKIKVRSVIEQTLNTKPFLFCLKTILLANYCDIPTQITDTMLDCILKTKKPEEKELETIVNEKIAVPKSIAMKILQHYLVGLSDFPSAIKTVAVINAEDKHVFKENLEEEEIRSSGTEYISTFCSSLNGKCALAVTHGWQLGKKNDNGIIQIWNLKTLECEKELKAPNEKCRTVTALDFSENGEYLAAAFSDDLESKENVVVIWKDTDQNAIVLQQSNMFEGSLISQLKFNNVGDKLACTAFNNPPYLTIIEYNKTSSSWSFKEPYVNNGFEVIYHGQVNGIAWSPDGKFLASRVTPQSRIDIFDTSSWKCVHKLEDSFPRTDSDYGLNSRGLEFSPNGLNFLYINSSHGKVNFVDTRNWKTIKAIDYLNLDMVQNPYCQKFFDLSPSGNYFFTGSHYSSELEFYDINEGKKVHFDYSLPTLEYTNICKTSADGNYLLYSWKEYLTIAEICAGPLKELEQFKSSDMMAFFYDHVKKQKSKTTIDDIKLFVENERIKGEGLKQNLYGDVKIENNNNNKPIESKLSMIKQEQNSLREQLDKLLAQSVDKYKARNTDVVQKKLLQKIKEQNESPSVFQWFKNKLKNFKSIFTAK